MGMVSIGFILFLLLTSNPFERLFPAPVEGRDLNPLLQDPEPAVAAAAAEAVGWLRHPASRPLLLERLAQGPASVQERVAWALGQFRAKEAVPQLTRLLWAKHEGLESMVAEALGLIDDHSAWPELHKMLYQMLEHGMNVRVKTIQALQQMGDKEIAPRIFQIVTEKVIPPTPMMPLPTYDATPVRAAALRFLREYGDTATGERLLKSFADTPPHDLRPVLAETVTKLTGRMFRPVPDETHTVYSVESLGQPPYQSVPPTPGVRLKP
jgi:HEAT repeat protein